MNLKLNNVESVIVILSLVLPMLYWIGRRVAKGVRFMDSLNEIVNKELTPNGGESMKDVSLSLKETNRTLGGLLDDVTIHLAWSKREFPKLERRFERIEKHIGLEPVND